MALEIWNKVSFLSWLKKVNWVAGMVGSWTRDRNLHLFVLTPKAISSLPILFLWICAVWASAFLFDPCWLVGVGLHGFFILDLRLLLLAWYEYFMRSNKYDIFFLTYIESQSKISLKGKNCFNLRELGVASKRTDPQCRIVVTSQQSWLGSPILFQNDS